MTLTDSHCHIHESTYLDPYGAFNRALKAGVTRLICVGTDQNTSREAVNFALNHENTWASVGIHPHDASSGLSSLETLEELIRTDINIHVRKIVAIGECGLDYFYNNSPKNDQALLLEAQLELASRHNLPLIFHVRNAFDDFWPIFDRFKGLRGVLHSYTDDLSNLDQALARGLYIGVNGISTFTKDEMQQKMYAAIPVSNMLLETDSPFLTPIPRRGTVNEPAFITHVAHHIANLQSINLEELSRATERNATTLFFNTKN